MKKGSMSLGRDDRILAKLLAVCLFAIGLSGCNQDPSVAQHAPRGHASLEEISNRIWRNSTRRLQMARMEKASDLSMWDC